jgi:hypothetical protein
VKKNNIFGENSFLTPKSRDCPLLPSSPSEVSYSILISQVLRLFFAFVLVLIKYRFSFLFLNFFNFFFIFSQTLIVVFSDTLCKLIQIDEPFWIHIKWILMMTIIWWLWKFSSFIRYSEEDSNFYKCIRILIGGPRRG